MRAFITGVTGQDGHYLSEFLINRNYEVYGLVRHGTRPESIPKHVKIVHGDVIDQSVSRTIETIAPNEVYHLAAVVVGAEEHPQKTLSTNIVGTLNVMEGAKQCMAKVFNAASSDMYRGMYGKGSIYAISKLAAVEIANLYRNEGLFVCNGVLFNHESPLRSDAYVTRKICKYVAGLDWCIKHDNPSHYERLKLGNLDKKRDWSHAADITKAMTLTLKQPIAGDYLIGSGVKHSVSDLLDVAFKHIGIHNWYPYVKQDESLIRKDEVDSPDCDNSAIREIGWKPQYTFETMIHEMVDNERKAIE